METFKQPMLAAKDFNPVTWDWSVPLAASNKLDGYRALVVNSQLVSRNFKPIANEYIRNVCSELYPTGFDGELMIVKDHGPVGSADGQHSYAYAPFNECSSAIAREEGQPHFVYLAFDWYTSDGPVAYQDRVTRLREWFAAQPPRSPERQFAQLLDYTLIRSRAELDAFEEAALAGGYEGVCLRTLQGPYKMGRSTLREAYLMKYIRKVRAEAIVIGFVEEFHNANVKTENAFGRTKRSSHKANKVGKGTLGALVVKHAETGVEFEVGTGFTAEQRASIWTNRQAWEGLSVVIESRPYGVLDRPRFPVFIGTRHSGDQDAPGNVDG